MMKKGLLVLPLLFSLLTFSSCSNKSSIHLEQSYKVDSFIYIDSNELLNVISSKKDFALMLGLKGCESCERVKPIIKEYIKDNNTPFYWIETSEYKKCVSLLQDDKDYSLKPANYSATLVLFDEGKDIHHINYNDKLYSTVSNFTKELTKRGVSISGYTMINDFEKIKYMNEEDVMYKKNLSSANNLKELVNNKSKVTILYSWFECPDCILLNDYLDPYMENNKNNLYVFEVSSLREDDQEWDNFKKEFEFDSYREGRVPSFVTYENGKKIDMCVFVNDVIEEQNGKYVITESFYKDKIEGMSSSSLEDLRNKSSKEEFKFIKEYLEKHL